MQHIYINSGIICQHGCTAPTNYVKQKRYKPESGKAARLSSPRGVEA